MMQKLTALAILLVYFAVIIDGMVRGEYGSAVTAMAPALSIAAGYLLGRDVLETFASRKRRNGESEDET